MVRSPLQGLGLTGPVSIAALFRSERALRRGDDAGETMEIFVSYRVSRNYWDSELKKVVAREGWVGKTPVVSLGTLDAKAVGR